MNKKFSSLVLSRFAPFARDGGGALRVAQNLNALRAIGDLDVLTIGKQRDAYRVDGVRQWRAVSLDEVQRRRIFLENIKNRLWPIRPGAHPGIDLYFSRYVNEQLGSCPDCFYDVAVVEEIALARYLPSLRKKARVVVYDAHNVESILREQIGVADQRYGASEKLRRLLLKGRMRREEGRALRHASKVWACSEKDAHLLSGLFGFKEKIHVVPNGIQVESYQCCRDGSTETSWTESPVTLLYVGSFAYAPNEQAAVSLIRGVYPAVRKMGRQCRIVLVGRNPTDRMHSAADGNQDVEITGAVDDVREYLSRQCVVALPIHVGSGTRLKILEAFAASRPVVCTQKGIEGIPVVDGEHYILAESANDMAAAAVELWDDQVRRARICNAAYRLVCRRFSWAAVAERIRDSLEIGNKEGMTPAWHDTVAVSE